MYTVVDDDHMVALSRPETFNYPAKVEDPWIPGVKTWNADLITNLFINLFSSDTTNIIFNIPIIQALGEDVRCWKHTPSGLCSSNIAYRLCFQNLPSIPREGSVASSSQELILLKAI